MCPKNLTTLLIVSGNNAVRKKIIKSQQIGLICLKKKKETKGKKVVSFQIL